MYNPALSMKLMMNDITKEYREFNRITLREQPREENLQNNESQRRKRKGYEKKM